MKRLVIAVVVLGCIVSMVACGKRYVGMHVRHNPAGWCQYYPSGSEDGKSGNLNRGAMVFRFIIKKGETEGNYVIESEIDSTQGSIKSFDAFVEGNHGLAWSWRGMALLSTMLGSGLVRLMAGLGTTCPL